MKVHRHTEDKEEYRCFSVSNNLLTRRAAVRVISNIPYIKITKKPKYGDDDIFCEFQLNGFNFTIDEPYGDNSEFDIMCEKPNITELEIIAKTFEAHKLDTLSLLSWLFILLPLSYVVYNAFT